MKRYFVGHKLNDEEVNEYYETITSKLAEKFGIKNLGARVAPHFTLKSPFESEKMEELERMLEKLAKEQKAIPFEIQGFGRFSNDFGNTIYLAVNNNPELDESAQQISDSIRNFGRKKNQTPKPLKLHVSLARYMDENQAQKAWQYLYSVPISKFNLQFDNIAIFEYFPGGWKIYREFNFLAN